MNCDTRRNCECVAAAVAKPLWGHDINHMFAVQSITDVRVCVRLRLPNWLGEWVLFGRVLTIMLCRRV